MRILVTGGAGFIGSHICETLLARGDEVIVLDNFNDYYDPSIKHRNIKPFEKDIVLYEKDIRDRDFLTKLFSTHRIDKIMHLAAMCGVRASLKAPYLYEDVNITGTYNLLELARLNDVANFVFTSSSSVYGISKRVPFREDDPIDCPVSPYAVTKRAGELHCFSISHLYKLPIKCIRVFTAYGERQRPEMAIHKFTRLISEGKPIPYYGDGTSRRDYTYVLDVVAGFIAALDKQSEFDIFNIGNSNTVSLKELVGIIEKHVGRKAVLEQMPEQPGDVPATYADISHSQSELGYSPKVDIETGIGRFVEWFKNNN